MTLLNTLLLRSSCDWACCRRPVKSFLERHVTLYEAMVLPLFDYCSAVWGSCGKMNSDYLEKLNRLPASIIEGRRIDQVDVRFTLHWPLLQLRRKYIGILVFKCPNGIAPTYLQHEFHFGSDVHGYNTRQKHHLRPPAARTTKYQGSFRYYGAKV